MRDTMIQWGIDGALIAAMLSCVVNAIAIANGWWH